ncbi:CYTH domain-containing protein [Desulfosarcina ovata]|uniref:Adenylate cyclase n=2 Tax=Desulfosarcina ovata TaxID=83564 RepID=A0A5K8AN38_9BACT|nr:CYTH domain-containing protein [Desulfosarcina ovata]BBO86098.1 adenylate cyclase [Desulfosarcina ovata subsp. sediminis]BBO93034.1 adenylate cyclase [Desulfosarcina ovata subsp. ovata]
MGIEIERKFLVRHLPESLDNASGVSIRQGYLIISADGTELRIRQKGARFFQTIKMGEGLRRTEIEIEISQAQFEQLWPHTEGRRVSKTRYHLPQGEYTAEVDRFAGALQGLLLVEVEFPSEGASRAFSPPEWFGTDVTEDKRYKNKHLAVNGIPRGSAP